MAEETKDDQRFAAEGLRIEHALHKLEKPSCLIGLVDEKCVEETAFKFSTVKDLVDRCTKTGLYVNGKKVELKTPAKRPHWLLKNTELWPSIARDGKLWDGNFSVVYCGRLRKDDVLTTAAIKCFKCNFDQHRTRKETEEEDKARVAFIREGQMVRELWHPNVVKFFGVAKIVDFGLSGYVEDLVGVSIERDYLPIPSMAPESLQKVAVFVPKSDVWSFGVVLYEIFTSGAEFFEYWTAKRIAAHIRRDKVPTLTSQFPPSIKTLMENYCWIVELDKRSTMDVVKKELERIQNEFPIVSMAQLTVNRTSRVTALTTDEIVEKEAKQVYGFRLPHQSPTHF
ncbi:Protein kinase domain-containing protein [Aphelenchoides besseyi]|nr:Protein kinase domain-containing protein [Aphelenchoides besseyi]